MTQHWAISQMFWSTYSQTAHLTSADLKLVRDQDSGSTLRDGHISVIVFVCALENQSFVQT